MLKSASEMTSKLAFDANSLNQLKLKAKDNSPEAIREVAKQFEAVFINMVMKSMRAATPQDGPFDNEQSRTFTAMLDQQLSENLASKGVGLADVLTRQLTKFSNGPSDNASNIPGDPLSQAVSSDSPTKTSNEGFNTFTPSLLQSNSYGSVNQAKAAEVLNTAAINQKPIKPEASLAQPIAAQPVTAQSTSTQSQKPSNLTGPTAAFHDRLSRHAQIASRETGMPANYLLGQAALETGWGKREITGKNGTPSHNLFGIKATGDWNGRVVETTTTEYINGIKQKRVEKFRAYGSYAESFKDFANLIQNNPRYKTVVSNLHSITGYANAMQKSGYATDPNYADKLASVINRVSI